jgi:hypothetical protein
VRYRGASAEDSILPILVNLRKFINILSPGAFIFLI